jgi:RHS repeat-associated protein
VVTDSNGSSQEAISYYPFGAAQSDTGGVSMSHKYTSQEFDSETGLYNYNARYYNPNLGRFISADTIVPDPFNPQAFNRYSYVINDPLSYSDPSGHSLHISGWIEQHVLGQHLVDSINKTAQNTTNAFLVNFFIDPTLGHYMLGQTKEGRNYIGGEIIVGTVVASVVSFECDGCLGIAWYSFAMGALEEMDAAYNAKREGKDVLNAVAVAGGDSIAASYAGEYTPGFISEDFGPDFGDLADYAGIKLSEKIAEKSVAQTIVSTGVSKVTNDILNNSIHWNDTWPMNTNHNGDPVQSSNLQPLTPTGFRSNPDFIQTFGGGVAEGLGVDSNESNDMRSRLYRSLSVTAK